MKIWKFQDDVDTDQIISSQYIMLPTIDEMKVYTFESLDRDFAKKVSRGDIIIAGRNFGCGSSREQAPRVLKELGITTVIAKSFARIFFRNSINIGFPLVVCEDIHDNIKGNETVTVSFEKGEIRCNGDTYYFNKFPEHILKIIKCGGLIEYINSV